MTNDAFHLGTFSDSTIHQVNTELNSGYDSVISVLRIASMLPKFWNLWV